MFQKLKVVTFVGTRPEIIRLSRVIPLLDQHCDHVLVHTGQNYDYELNEIFFSDLSIRKPNIFLEAAGATSAETIGNVIARADKLLREQMPQAVLILGDTNSCLAAISATWLVFQDTKPLMNTLNVQPYHHDRRLFHPFMAFMRFAKIKRGKVHD